MGGYCDVARAGRGAASPRMVLGEALILAAGLYVHGTAPCQGSSAAANIALALALWYAVVAGLAELVRDRRSDYLAFVSIAGLVIPLSLLIGLTQLRSCPAFTLAFALLAAFVYALRPGEWREAFATLDLSPYEEVREPPEGQKGG